MTNAMTSAERNRLFKLQRKFLKLCRVDLERIGQSTPLWGPGSPSADDLRKMLYPHCAGSMQHAIDVREGTVTP